MASRIENNVAAIRVARFGIETREPIADSLENTTERKDVKEYAEDAIDAINIRKDELYAELGQAVTEASTPIDAQLSELTAELEQAVTDASWAIDARISELNGVLRAKDAELAAKEPRIASMEAKHITRIISHMETELRREIEWIEKITHIIHDPPTLYTLIGNSNISVNAISDSDYKAIDAGSSVSVISGDDYRMNTGANWDKQNIDDPTHEEYEYITHWVPDYRLSFKRANEN